MSTAADHPISLARAKHMLQRALSAVRLSKFRFADGDYGLVVERQWDDRELAAYHEARFILENAAKAVARANRNTPPLSDRTESMKKRRCLLEPKAAQAAAPIARKAEVDRLKIGGSGKYALHVDIDRPDYWTYNWASGAGIARILDRINSNVDFLMITNFRAADWVDGVNVPRTKTQNDQAFSKMPRQLREILGTNKVGAYWMVGHWTEKDKNTGAITDNLEYSWLFTKDDPGVTDEEWMAAAKELTQQYEQIAFIIRLNGEISQRSDNGEIQRLLTSSRAVEDAWANLAQLRAEMDDDPDKPYGYSEIRKVRERDCRQPLTSPEVTIGPQAKESAYRVTGDGQEHSIAFFMALPDNISAKRSFAAMGIQAHPPA
jgi:hypothetical protein